MVMAWHEEVREFLASNVTPRRIGINLTDHQRKEAIARSRTSDDGGGDEVPCARARERERERERRGEKRGGEKGNGQQDARRAPHTHRRGKPPATTAAERRKK